MKFFFMTVTAWNTNKDLKAIKKIAQWLNREKSCMQTFFSFLNIIINLTNEKLILKKETIFSTSAINN